MSTASESTNGTVEDFIAYEYRNIATNRELASVYADCLPQFGWELENNTFNSQANRVSMTFKRNRKIKNKLELNKLQRRFEESINNATHLKGSKTTRANITSYGVGLIGTAFMAGSVFSFLAGNIAACVVLAIPGFILWGLAYVFYRSLVKKRSTEIIPEIDREFDSAYSVCEQAHALLAH